jgi:hypothetical protein
MSIHQIYPETTIFNFSFTDERSPTFRGSEVISLFLVGLLAGYAFFSKSGELNPSVIPRLCRGIQKV